MELVNLKTIYRIEGRILNILENNKFKNIFKDIKYLNEFCECYIIIEEERIKINRLTTSSKIIYMKSNKRLIDACRDRHIYLNFIYNNWDFYKEKLNKYL